MLVRSFLLFVLLFLQSSILVACRMTASGADEEQSDTSVPAVSSSPTLTVIPVDHTPVPQPTPSTVTLTVWGPLELSPLGTTGGAEWLAQEMEAFEQFHGDIEVVYEAKPESGAASMLNYLRSASAVAPTLVPDLVIFSPNLLPQLAQTDLLSPLDQVIGESLRGDLYPFAFRDTQVDGSWMALPLAIQIEHGAARSGERDVVPLTLDRMVRENAPIWLFAGQAGADGQMSNPLLLQLLSLMGRTQGETTEGPLGANALPPQEELVTLFATFQEAQKQGAIPRQNLLLNDELLLFDRLLSDQADFIETSSHTYLMQRGQGSPVTFAPVPTLTGNMITVIDGYLIALTTGAPRQQEAATRFTEWLFEPARLVAWSRASHWLPARRSALFGAIEDGAYQTFLDQQLMTGWLRPGGTEWVSFAQAVQEQFRAVMTEQTSPVAATEMLLETYAP
ncbi:MAG: extracellular solute-binding protein [Ardenticatenaceae bacterium]